MSLFFEGKSKMNDPCLLYLAVKLDMPISVINFSKLSVSLFLFPGEPWL